MVIVKMPERIKPRFSRYIGVDYSGAETPDSSLKGLRVYETSRESAPVEVEPPPNPRKYWTQRGLAEWLAEQLSGVCQPSLVSTTAFPFPCGISRFSTWSRTALAEVSTQSAWGPDSLLALRRLGNSCGQVRTGGGLPVAVEQEHSTGGPHTRPARRLCGRRLAAAGGYRRQPPQISQARYATRRIPAGCISC